MKMTVSARIVMPEKAKGREGDIRAKSSRSSLNSFNVFAVLVSAFNGLGLSRLFAPLMLFSFEKGSIFNFSFADLA